MPWLEERHPDHVAASALVTKALSSSRACEHGLDADVSRSERFVPRQVLYYAMRHRMTPSFVIDTSAARIASAQAIALPLQAR